MSNRVKIRSGCNNISEAGPSSSDVSRELARYWVTLDGKQAGKVSTVRVIVPLYLTVIVYLFVQFKKPSIVPEQGTRIDSGTFHRTGCERKQWRSRSTPASGRLRCRPLSLLPLLLLPPRCSLRGKRSMRDSVFPIRSLPLDLNAFDGRSQRTEVSWRRQCVSTAACVLIGSAIGLGGDGEVLAGEVRAEAVGSGAGKIVRWSDKRRCPQWRENSLENIVPENLPRQSGGRGSNKFAAFGEHVTAPPVGVGPGLIRFRSDCFTL
ncbi:hypothetical protein ZIOFF_036514 [Zingiber officinale]|uniref:Uncharacterized protein n=1 Tax=Zingiber officinale TaxID=94328 RepID=A0A8J5GAG8_ZINOF|nr:hypothetical protein ZIOFF_036514 [Zingiber officinale]